MTRLGQRDLRALLAVLEDVARVWDAPHGPARLLDAIQRFIPCDLIAYNDMDPRIERARVISDPPLEALTAIVPDGDRYLARITAQHPLVAHYFQTGDTKAVKVSDFLSARQFHQLDLYQVLFRPFGLEHQMATVLAAQPPRVVGICLNRTRDDFSERDRQVLDLLSPHLIQALDQAQRYGEIKQSLEAGDHAVIALTHEAYIRYATDRALVWLANYFDQSSPASSLPGDLADWIRVQQTRLGVDGTVPPIATPLVVERDGWRLVVDLLAPRERGARPLLLLREERPVDLSPAMLGRLGLSHRETEVLAWVARGKTDEAIATVLYISRRTVQKHLEHIYRKLGVGDRASAVRAALGQPTEGAVQGHLGNR